MGQPMLESDTLLNARIGFLRTHLALIHIPHEVYSLFIQPILAVLLHNDQRDDKGETLHPRKAWDYWQPFVNISITPNECSVVCPREQADNLFMPIIERLDPDLQQDVSISTEDYSVITIEGQGLEVGQRVLDLTSPLAIAGIPIFFITTYYTDFILVPFSSRPKVIHALEDRGFVFEATDEDGEAGQMTNPASPLAQPHGRNASGSSFDWPPTASTPPPTNIDELQTKTFKILARNDIQPHFDRDLELITCAGIKDNTSGIAASKFTQGKLQLGVARCLTSLPAPKFFSITLVDCDSASITMEKRLLEHFPDGGDEILLGIDGPVQIPITLDLRNLPLESTGIVCGVSSRIIEGMKRRLAGEPFNMSYLSTLQAGHVIVYEDELDDVISALKGVQLNGVVNGESS